MFAVRSRNGRPAPQRGQAKAAGKAAGPRPLADLAGRLNVAPRVRALVGLQTTLAPIQRAVAQITRRSAAHFGEWYSSHDEERYFSTREAAEAHERQILQDRRAEREEGHRAKRQRREEEHRAKMKTDFPGYVPPEADVARLFKLRDQDYDDVPLVKPTPDNVKAYSERSFAERRAGEFQTQVMKLGGGHFVLQPGTDIGLTPALLRPDLKAPRSVVPLSRDGQPKTYPDIAFGLDEAARKYSRSRRASIKDTRIRMGKDIDRFTRGNESDGTHRYSEQDRHVMQELAGVLRLDKGRVPKATKAIRESFTSGEHSFRDLLVEERYPGAGKGGVERLRRVQSADGYESEGSDIEEKPAKRPAKKKESRVIKKRKRDDDD